MDDVRPDQDLPRWLSGRARCRVARQSDGVAGWYRSFLDSVVISHGSAWGYAIELSELVVGLALVAGALLWLLRWDHLSAAGRRSVLLTIAIASLAGIFMTVNFHLANGAPHPWLIPKDGFDEGVDLDSLLPVIQLIVAGVSLALWRASGDSFGERRMRAHDDRCRAGRSCSHLAEHRHALRRTVHDPSVVHRPFRPEIATGR